MNTEPEHLDAVLADMRRDARSGEHADGPLIEDYADRIEAAYKREHAEWHAETDAAKDDRNRVACRMRREFAEKCRNCERAPDNAAAMRAALESAHRTLKLVCEHAVEFIQPRMAEEIIHAGAAVERALSAPARNCDRFATEQEAWEFYLAHTPDNGNIIDGFPPWLFATKLVYGDAAESDGGEK